MKFPDTNVPLPAIAAGRTGASQTGGNSAWREFLPLVVMPLAAMLSFNVLTPWIFMWAMAFALYAGCKWLTWRRARIGNTPAWRNWAYLFAWPGMDARAFLRDHVPVARPSLAAWFAAVSKTLFGAALVWVVVPILPASQPLLRGWTGMVGVIFLLHFGTFHLLALLWQSRGVNAVPLMRAPIMAGSLAEFWSWRWNSAFNLLARDYVFRPLHRRLGTAWATMAVFLASGLVHDLLLSVPARGGYGLPTLYFLLQGLGVIGEHTRPGRRLGLGRGLPGRAFTILVTAGPAFWLLHPPFIQNVILPMLHAIGATGR